MINLFFITQDYSGVRTYTNELLNYLCKQPEIFVYRIFILSTEYKAYTVKENYNIADVYIPQVQQKRSISLKKYAARCMDLMAPLLQDKKNIIFHLNNSEHAAIGEEAKLRHKAKLIYTQHYLPAHFTSNATGYKVKNSLRSINIPDNRILNLVDKVICISRFAKVTTVKCGIDSNKIELIYNGYGSVEDYFPAKIPKSYLGFSNEEFLIIYAGRISRDKGVFNLINAFKKILLEFPQCRLVIAGAGDLETLMHNCREIMGKVTIAGKLSTKELQKLYNIADLGVVPSHYELLGYTPIEMMAHRLPVIISDVPGMNELIKNGQNGLICKMKKEEENFEPDEESLNENIRKILKEVMKAKTIAENGRKTWKKYFTARQMGQQTIKVYEQMVLPNPAVYEKEFLEKVN